MNPLGLRNQLATAGLAPILSDFKNLPDLLSIEQVGPRIYDMYSVAAGILRRVACRIGEPEQGLSIVDSIRWRNADTHANREVVRPPGQSIARRLAADFLR